MYPLPLSFRTLAISCIFLLCSSCYEVRTYQTSDGNGNTVECVGKSNSISPGDKIGQHQCWYLDEDGNRDMTRPYMVGHYKDGEADGYFIYWTYHPNGRLKSQVIYDRKGVRTEDEHRRGTWVFWDAKGNKTREEKYNKNGEKVEEIEFQP